MEEKASKQTKLFEQMPIKHIPKLKKRMMMKTAPLVSVQATIKDMSGVSRFRL